MLLPTVWIELLGVYIPDHLRLRLKLETVMTAGLDLKCPFNSTAFLEVWGGGLVLISRGPPVGVAKVPIPDGLGDLGA